MSSSAPSFIFVTCQVGAEAALKKELARDYPQFRFSYSRPGFVTFKTENPLQPDFELSSVFARTYGLSLSKVDAKDGEPLQRATRVIGSVKDESKGRLLFHVWERDQYLPNEEPPYYSRGQWEGEAIDALSEAAKSLGLSDRLVINQKPEPSEKVIDVIVVNEDEWWVGTHIHGAGHSPLPGGREEIAIPEQSPSRAYGKLEQAIRWSGAKIEKGDTAIEIGSAPGGASFNLLEKGLKVVGIDPRPMDPVVMNSPGFRHIAKPVAQVMPEELPNKVDWILLDLNVNPSIALFSVDRIAVLRKLTLSGLILTVKLTDWKFADQIPSMLDHVRSMGMARVRAKQLPSAGQEFTIVGLTRRALQR